MGNYIIHPLRYPDKDGFYFQITTSDGYIFNTEDFNNIEKQIKKFRRKQEFNKQWDEIFLKDENEK